MSQSKCHWLVQSNKFDPVSVMQLAEEIQRQGMIVSLVSEVPEVFWNIYPQNQCVLFYGSIEFAHQVNNATEDKWIPGVICTSENFLCTTYYPYFQKYLLASSSTTRKFGKLMEYKERIFNYYGTSNQIFLRPNSGDKIFTGQIITYDDFEEELKNLNIEGIPDDEIVIISKPRNDIDVEWRFVVADHEVITGTRYSPWRLRLREQTNDLDGRALVFAQEVVDTTQWHPDRIWCLDICHTTDDDKLYVLEINSFSCSGLYACNPKSIVEHASRIALECWNNNRLIDWAKGVVQNRFYLYKNEERK